jgi:hypothetical protein
MPGRVMRPCLYQHPIGWSETFRKRLRHNGFHDRKPRITDVMFAKSGLFAGLCCDSEGRRGAVMCAVPIRLNPLPEKQYGRGRAVLSRLNNLGIHASECSGASHPLLARMLPLPFLLHQLPLPLGLLLLLLLLPLPGTLAVDCLVLGLLLLKLPVALRVGLAPVRMLTPPLAVPVPAVVIRAEAAHDEAANWRVRSVAVPGPVPCYGRTST